MVFLLLLVTFDTDDCSLIGYFLSGSVVCCTVIFTLAGAIIIHNLSIALGCTLLLSSVFWGKCFVPVFEVVLVLCVHAVCAFSFELLSYTLSARLPVMSMCCLRCCWCWVIMGFLVCAFGGNPLLDNTAFILLRLAIYGLFGSYPY